MGYFNEQQKSEFISCLSGTEVDIANNLFTNLASYESMNNTDICDIEMSEYADLINYSDINTNTFSYYMAMYNLLYKYRVFCITRNYIDKTKFMSKYKTNEERLDVNDLYKSFSLYKDKVWLYTPDILFDMCCRKFFTEVRQHPLYDKSINLDEYYLAFLMLQYFGFENDDYIELERASFSELINFESGMKILHLYVNGKDIVVKGKSAQLIYNVKSANRLEYYSTDNRKWVKYLHEDKVFLMGTDREEKQMQVRPRRIYVSMNKRINENEEDSFPGIINIKSQGTIYRMCVSEYDRLKNLLADKNKKDKEVHDIIISLYRYYYEEKKNHFSLVSKDKSASPNKYKIKEISMSISKFLEYYDKQQEWLRK